MSSLAAGPRATGTLQFVVLLSILSSLALLAGQVLMGDPSRSVRYATAFFLLSTAAASWMLSIVEKSSQRSWRSVIVVYWTACWLSAVHYLVHAGFEAGFYRLSDVLGYDAGVPFGHRLLFVWVANGSRILLPGAPLSFHFFLTQALLFVAAGYAVYRLSCLFAARKFAAVSGIVATVMWMTTYTYYTFYDVGIIAAFAACLVCLAEGRFKLYLLFFSISILNHEIVALLIPIGGLMLWRQGARTQRIAAFVLAQLMIYSTVRLVMFGLLPQPAAFYLRPGTNIELVTNAAGYIVKSTWKLAVLLAFSLAGVRSVEERLRPMLLILPLLLVTTTLFGRYSEARQLDAFIPVATALMVTIVSQTITHRHGRPAA